MSTLIARLRLACLGTACILDVESAARERKQGGAMEYTIDTLVRQFERGRLTRRQLVQGLLVVAASPALAQERPVGAFRPTVIDHVQITVTDLKATQQFYEKLFGVTTTSPNPTQLSLRLGSAGNSISVHSESGPIKPIDHFGIAVEDFSTEVALATVKRVVPGMKAEKNGTSVFVIGPDGVRVQIVPARK
jgi:catechol 2,3-dioxygenase-like lactoylglutathione lyase family enzyme